MQCAQSTHRPCLVRPVLTMKISALFALLFLTLVCLPDVASEDENQDPCSDFRALVSKEGRLGCTRENEPVRGVDGKTYGNKCTMCAELFQKEAKDKGKENDKRIRRTAEESLCNEFRDQLKNGTLFCTRENDPIIGFDGKTYGNKCSMCKVFFEAEAKKKIMETNLKVKRELADTPSFTELCSPYRQYMTNGQIACTRENDPVLGPDGKIHGNKCSMCGVFFKLEEKEKAAVEASAKTKREADKALCSEFQDQVRNGMLPCTREHSPVQGPDGKKYGNKCFMCARIFRLEEEKKNSDRKAVETENKVKREAVQKLCNEYRSYLRNGRLACTRENDPVMGFDGKLHGNRCSMCEEFFKLEEKEKKAKEDREHKVKRETIQEKCNEYRNYIVNGELFCTRESDPIRGIDGKLYGNTCSMCKNFFKHEAREMAATASRLITKREVTKDACNEFRSLVNNGSLYCTRENDPVRGPDGKTHGNKCAMCKALFQKEDNDRKMKEDEDRKKKEDEDRRNAEGNNQGGGGAGKPEDQCSEFWDEWKKGGLSCTRESDPVRDANGKSYNNKCAMCKEILDKEAAEKERIANFRDNNSTNSEKVNCDEYRKQMKNGKLICTRESDPVRGPDGKTHGNKCAMCKKILEKEAEDKKSSEEKSSKEDPCNEYRNTMRNNEKYICTRENDPVRGPDGKTHVNKCAMCQDILAREANERKRTEEENKSNYIKEDGNKDKCNDSHNRRNSGNNGCARPSDPAHVQAVMKTDERREEKRHINSVEEDKYHQKSSNSKESDICNTFRLIPRVGYLCPKNLHFVCGDNGKTYTHPCRLCEENLNSQTKVRIAKEGKCEDEPQTSSGTNK